MIFRVSQQLSIKIKAGPLPALPPDKNPLADWSASAFVADRMHYILLSNTPSLYSTVISGKNIANEDTFVERALHGLQAFLEADGQATIYRSFIAPDAATTRFAKALDRSVTGSMNDMIKHAKFWLAERNVAPFDVGFRINEIPMSALARNGSKYGIPKDTFKLLAGT